MDTRAFPKSRIPHLQSPSTCNSPSISTTTPQLALIRVSSTPCCRTCEVYRQRRSTTHAFGWERATPCEPRAKRSRDRSMPRPKRSSLPSGATESDKFGDLRCCRRAKRRGDHLISVLTEHKAVLDPCYKLRQRGYEVTYASRATGQARQGIPRPTAVRDALQPTTCWSASCANNEIASSKTFTRSLTFCHEAGVILHCDATQAVANCR